MNALRPSASEPGDSSVESASASLRASTRVSRDDFETVYATHFKQVWGALRRLGVREADVADVTQKVFITAYRKLDTFEGRAHIRTWLLGICERTASDYRRSAPVRREVSTDVATLELTAPAHTDVVVELGSRQRVQLAETILDKLPEEQRAVFVLFELEELSGPEIAALLDISVGTVRSRLRLARETFTREVQRLTARGLTEMEGA
jgi:RNA polymerase sigma-70 factor, ECF subfamily